MSKIFRFRSVLVFLLCIVFRVTGYTQVNTPAYWIKHYGGTNSDYPVSIKSTPDGGTVFCGITRSNNIDVSGLNGTEYDVWVVKLDKNGIIQWQKTYLTTNQESPKELILTSDGGYAVCSWIIIGSSYHTLILKLSNNGTLEWQKQLTSNNAYAQGITETADGGFSFTGYINGTPNGEFAGQPNHGFASDVFIAKLNSSGTFLWGKLYGGSNGDIGIKVKQLSDGNLLAAVHSYSSNGDITGGYNSPAASGDYWIVKLSPAGNIIWQKSYGGIGNEMPRDAFEKDNRYYIIGTTSGTSAAPSGDITAPIDGNDIWFLVLDTAGTLVRQKSIGGTGNADVALSIAPTLDGKLIIGGNSNSNNGYVSGNNGQSDYALIKIDTLGNKIFGKLFGNSSDEFGGVQLGARAAVNADTTFSLIAGMLGGGGEIPVTYGSDDILLIRFKDTSLYQDLYSKIIHSTNVFKGRPINYKLAFGKSNSTVSEDTVILKFASDNNLQLVSVTRPVSLVDGDTLIWKIPKTAIINADTISIVFQLDPALAVIPDSLRVRSFIGPYTTEFYQTNNVWYAASRVKNQNAGIINSAIDVFSTSTFPAHKPILYSVTYSFQNQLDTLYGIVRFIKDPKTQLIEVVPAYSSMSGDTLLWNFSVTPGTYNRNIDVTLRADTPYVRLGDSIRTYTDLRFITQDTGILTKKDSLKQFVTQICIIPSTVNTTLPYPQGVQWLQAVGGSAQDMGADIISITDTTFITSTTSSSGDGDITPVPDALFENALVTKYRTNGNKIWQKLLGGNGSDVLLSTVKAADQSLIGVGYTASNNGIFSTLHPPLGPDVWLFKLDSNGNTAWHKTLGGSDFDGGVTLIRKFRDNRYFVLARTKSRDGDVINPYPAGPVYPWMFMIDESGTIIWQKVLRDTMFTSVRDVQITPDNAILIVTEKLVSGTVGYIEYPRLIKIDSLGNILWLKGLRHPTRFQRFASAVINADSTFMFAGNSEQNTTNTASCFGDHIGAEIWVVKTDKTGTVLWEKYYGGDRDDVATHIIKALDGGYFICGKSFSNNGNVTGNHDASGATSDAWIIKLDSSGAVTWQKTIGGSGDEDATRMIMLNTELYVNGVSTSYNNGDIFGSKGLADGILFKIGTTNTIRGMVYADNNGNHIKETNEPFLTGGFVKSVNGGFTNSSNIVNGYFASAVDTGTYVSNPVTNSPYFQPFPVSHISNFNSFGNTDTVDFAMVPSGAVNDLRITILGLSPARPGFELNYIVKYENIGTTVIPNGSIIITKDARSSFISASLPYTSLLVDTIKWAVNNFAPLEMRTFLLTLQAAIPPSLVNGDTLHITGIIHPVVNDSNVVNNLSNLNQLVTGSYDPNDKTETHGPWFPSQLLPTGEPLNYVIRFQNTGTDTAFRVLIRDTLDAKLDWNSLQMLGASHNYRLTITNGNLVEWKFDPIMLPDSNHNEAASHGFVAFSIKPLNSLTPGDTIANRAGIYFDFNPPVITNTQHTIIDNGIFTCPGSSKIYTSGIPGAFFYKWQVDSGSGYSDLPNNSIYSGVNTDTLQLINPPTSAAGNKYRCIVTTADGNIPSNEYQLKFGVTWTGAISNAWENPGNWDCGVLPDMNTDVIIKQGTVIVSSNTAIRSLSLKPGIEFWINAGNVFSVLH